MTHPDDEQEIDTDDGTEDLRASQETNEQGQSEEVPADFMPRSGSNANIINK